MLTHLIMKELRSILLSPKFPTTFAICSILMLLSVYVGIQEYSFASEQYSAARQLYDEQMHQAHSWLGLKGVALRQPSPMQVFVSGVSFDVGRLSEVGTFRSSGAPTLDRSMYSEEPLFAIFRFLDFAFIVQIVLTLFAIVFTYDAISGERESGTLQLTLSHPVGRHHYLLAKSIGAWLGMVLPMTIPIALSVLLAIVMGVPFSGSDWMQLMLLLALSVLYFSVFIVMGLAVSAVTRRSSLSFLVALSVWIVFVLVIPRGGVMMSDQVISVPSVAQIDGIRSAYAKDAWAEFMATLDSIALANRDDMSEDDEWARFVFQDSLRKECQNIIDANDQRVMEDLRRKKSVRENVGYALSRLSPAGSYYLAALRLSAVDAGVKDRYEDAILQYRNQFKEYVSAQEAKQPGAGGINIEMDSKTGFKFTDLRSLNTLDVSGVPRFQPPVTDTKQVVASVIPDFGILGGFLIVGFFVAFIGFLRYDVRQQ